MRTHQKRWLKWTILSILILIGFLFISFLIYAQIYYHADSEAALALESDDLVTVTQTGYGFHFDGPSEDEAMVFYPGAKVEETAYAPLLHALAEKGLDVCLVKMPFRMAVFGINKASSVMKEHDYSHWYIGGHSMGGSMAASYASGHTDALDGVILLGAYPVKKLDDSLSEVLIYGSEDHVLNRDRLSKGRSYAPDQYIEHVIEGGNHAYFGNYGEQKGDGTASVTRQRQQEETVRMILDSKISPDFSSNFSREASA